MALRDYIKICSELFHLSTVVTVLVFSWPQLALAQLHDISGSPSYFTGSVGIGTTNPQVPLETYTGSAGSQSLLRLNAPNTVGNNGNIDFAVTDIPVARVGSVYAATNDIELAFSTFNGSLAERMRINNNGNVGIGTSSVSGNLEVYGNAATTQLTLLSGSASQYAVLATGGTGVNNYYGTAQGVNGLSNGAVAGDLIIRTQGNNMLFNVNSGGNPAMYISTAGNVGIATSAPKNILDVNGSLAVGTFAGTASGAANELIVGGAVGIGTTGPGALLQVGGASASTFSPSLSASNLGNASFVASNSLFTFGLDTNTPYDEWIQAHNVSSSSLPLSLNPSGGNVGIGTTSPGASLTVNGNVDLGTGQGVGTNSASRASSITNLYSPTAMTATTVGTESILRMARSGTSGTKYNASADFLLGTSTAALNAYTRLDINLGNGATSTPDTNVMTLLSGGYVGIGTTGPSYLLHVGSASASGAVAGFQNSSDLCTLTPASSSPTWSCSSDMRLKKDIGDAGAGLPWLDDMRVRDFTMKATGERQTGVIAQEMQLTHPDMVHMGANGFYTVDSPNPWKLVKAIQELKAENDNLRARLDALEAARH